MATVDDKFRDVDEATTERRPLPLPPPDETPPDTKPVLPASGFPEDPPELRERIVSALGGEMRSFEYVDRRLDMLASEVRDGFGLIGKELLPEVRNIRADVGKVREEQAAIRKDQLEIRKEQTEQRRALVSIADKHNEIVDRIDSLDARQQQLEQRVAATEAELAALKKPAAPRKPTKVQRPNKRARRK